MARLHTQSNYGLATVAHPTKIYSVAMYPDISGSRSRHAQLRRCELVGLGNRLRWRGRTKRHLVHEQLGQGGVDRASLSGAPDVNGSTWATLHL
jgi:hypothetical protein